MSKKNYTNYSKPETIPTPMFDEELKEVVSEEVVEENAIVNEGNTIIDEVIDEETIPEIPVEVLSEELADEVNEEKNLRYAIGVVENCESLRVRQLPSSDGEILTTIDKGTELEIDLENSTDEFYNIYIPAGIHGYCMKKFITLQ